MFKLKLKTIFLIIIMLFSFSFVNVRPVSAQLITSDLATLTLTGLKKVRDALKVAYQKSGSIIFQQTLSNALNKIAIDTATWIASGDRGQTPLINLKEYGSYLVSIVDEAAGEFIERSVNAWSQAFVDRANADLLGCTNQLMVCNYDCLNNSPYNVNYTAIDKCAANCNSLDDSCFLSCELNNYLRDVSIDDDVSKCIDACITKELECRQAISNLSAPGQAIMRQVNVCQPSSPMGFQVKMQISLGLVDHVRPRAPNCTASDMWRSWEEAGRRIDFTNFDDRQWTQNLTRIFHPTNNELGIAMIMSNDMFDVMDRKVDIARLNIDQSGRWLDVRHVSGLIKKPASQTKSEHEAAGKSLRENIGKTTGDIFVDAANVFLNTLALQYYQRAMQNLPELLSGGPSFLTDPDADPSVSRIDVKFGEGASLRERISQIISPQYSSLDDYNVLSRFAVCPDPNNPGPTDCVIDESFVQAIMSRQTIIEAINDGNLRGSWTFSSDRRNSSAYQLRSLMILRQHRILPVGWEIAVLRMEELGKTATLRDLISCFSGDDQYNSFSQGFVTNDVAWCRGLVDPNWVLKAPLSYCRKQGVGSHILSKTVMPGQPAIGSTPAVPSSLEIKRDDNYCADYQTCIKESADGSCLFYGYCNEEKHIWTFGQASCDPVYNTCQSFSAPNGSRFNYLANTLDFSCSADDVGCKAYLLRGEFVEPRVNWNEDFKYYFNNKMTNCSSTAEGCTELIRVRPGLGANLNKLSDLSSYDIGTNLDSFPFSNYWQFSSGGDTHKRAEIVEFQGEKVINFEASDEDNPSYIGILSNFTKPNTPGATLIIPGYAYTLSADVYLRNNQTRARLVLGDWSHTSSIQQDADNNVVNSWQRLSVTYYMDEDTANTLNHMDYRVQGVGLATTSDVELYVKNIKLELSSWDTFHTLYGAFKTYQKLIPPYLANACYVDAFSGTKDYRLKEDAPAICNNFTRQCNKDEVGCELFTNNIDNFSVAAKVATTDYCWGECSGYDMYVAQASTFHSSSPENIIPRNSVTCQASEVGCSEFTNLETIARGGEDREYFSQLRRCIKPSSQCDDFYTWQGSDESGYQLRTMLLEKDGDNLPKKINDDDSCSEAIYFKPPSDPEYNPDCRQIYNKGGAVAYVSLFNTIVCSNNCQSYRMTEKNINRSIDQTDCNDATTYTHWDSQLNVCYECKDGGIWDSTQNACIYSGLPSESRSCPASANGCREYSGKLGSNIRLISAFDFKNGLAGWTTGPCSGTAHVPVLSQNSTSNNGNSLKYDSTSTMTCDEIGDPPGAWLSIKKALAAQEGNGIKLPLGYNLRNDRSYSLRILAKADTVDVLATFSIESSTSTQTLFNPDEISIKIDGQWRIYDLYLPFLEHEVDENTALVIRTDNKSFFIDSLILNEVSDKYYLIRNSSFIPDICYYDVLDNYRGADYNLGCSAWTGRQNTTHYLRRFSSLCHESSIGCELMINTYNYSDWQAKDFDSISVPADSFIYAIYNPNYLCSASNKGCSRMAEISGQEVNRSITEVFKNNNPDNYDDSICSEEGLGCEQFSSGAATYYFKDPGFNTCVYRHPNDPSDLSGKNWYKSEVKRCDLDDSGSINGAERFGRVCFSDNDCSLGTCIADKNDYPCSVSYLKTIGLGDRVPTPDQNVAICDSRAVGCTEYIDPYSQHASNLVFNSEYLNNYEGWEDNQKQTINIIPNTLYQFTANASGPIASSTYSLDILQGDNSFITTSTPLTISDKDQVIIFNSRRNTSLEIDNTNADARITLKPVILDYQISQNLDTSSCNGIVNADNGCVLFNQRSISGRDYNPFRFNPFDTDLNRSPQPCQAGTLNCLANTLIKVQPDRTCSRWLDCLTYVDDPETGERICYDLGECTSLDEYGNCSNFISFVDSSNNPLISNTNTNFNINASGYSSIGRYYIGEMKEVGINTEVHFDFEGNNIALHCITKEDDSKSCTFDNNIITDSIIDSPAKAEVEYPAQGKKYLKVPAHNIMYPHSERTSFRFEAGRTYYLHYLLNTSKSGVDAKAQIYNFNNPNFSVELSASANSGWERIIHRFSVATSSDYKIRFKSDSDQISYYYVDDIHIEPVLQVGPDEYIAKDCRLFPETSSFACRSSFDNVVKNGLEGYCLERDPNNTNTCLMWYPVDQISSSQLYGGTSFGYQGKAPLYYCSEVNADFLLLEKRKSVKIGQHDRSLDEEEPASKDECYLDGFCGGASGQWNYVTIRERKKDSYIENIYCVPRLDRHNVRVGNPVLLPDSHGVCNSLSSSQIKEKKLSGDPPAAVFVNEYSGENYGIEPGFYDVWGQADGFHAVSDTHNDQMNCRQCSEIDELNHHDPPIAVYDLINKPQIEADLKFLENHDVNKVYNLTCNSFIELVDPYGVNKAWAQRVSNFSDPYNTPKFISDQLLEPNPFYKASIPAVGTCQDGHDLVGNCNDYQDLRCIDQYDCIWCGINGWRQDSCDSGESCNCHNDELYGCFSSAPAYCISDDNHYCVVNTNYCNSSNEEDCLDKNTDPPSQYCVWQDSEIGDLETALHRYGRNREDVPFGAAVLPDNFNFHSSPLIPLRSQYSSRNNQDILAGRPYGCDGASCDKVGQCSLDPNVFCIYDDYVGSDVTRIIRANYINSSSCAKGGYGVCTPLWWGNFSELKAVSGVRFFQYPLQSLFLRSFQGFKYDFDEREYKSEHLIRFQNATGTVHDDLTQHNMTRCDNDIREDDEWCAVWPQIKNIRLTDLSGNEVDKIGAEGFEILQAGIYKLTFNTEVDPEQQPLNRIEINWGDNNYQVISNQDHRPFDNRPHIIYHYYRPGQYQIGLKAFDNWGFWRDITY